MIWSAPFGSVVSGGRTLSCCLAHRSVAGRLKETAPRLAQWGFDVGPGLGRIKPFRGSVISGRLTKRIQAQYLMVSFAGGFQLSRYRRLCAPDRKRDSAALPRVRLALCPDVGRKRSVNPQLKLAGDGVSRSDLAALRTYAPGIWRTSFWSRSSHARISTVSVCWPANSGTCTSSVAGGSPMCRT